MKGTLAKTEQGWVVYWSNPQEYNEPIHSLPLHPDFIETMETCFTSKCNLVEFDIVEKIPESCHNNPFCNGDETCIQCYIKYAKLINIDNNKTIDPYISDNFQIGPDGAYEHEESETEEYPELEGTINLCNDINQNNWDNLFNDVESKLDTYIPIRVINYIKNTYHPPIKIK